jgi:hypothetical protein
MELGDWHELGLPMTILHQKFELPNMEATSKFVHHVTYITKQRSVVFVVNLSIIEIL